MGFRTILTILGALLATLGASMLLPAIADALAGNQEWRVFLASSLFTTVIGAGLWASSVNYVEHLTLRQAFLLTTLAWVSLTLFGAIPFAWTSLNMSWTDAIFESMSGITTTGATVLSNLEAAPPGILLWRGILQWLGGLGIVVMAIAVLPMLQVGGMQMFKAEAFETPDKILPRAANIASGMVSVYLILTLACAILYWIAGMSVFEALVHAMTTVATGGYSTRDGSIGAFNSATIEYISITFMILGALPFALYLSALAGSFRGLISDSQVRVFLSILLAATVFALWVQVNNSIETGETAWRHAMFSVTSIITGTGYASTDFGTWHPSANALFFVLMFLGGCTGSTSCGIKIFRFQVLWRDLQQHIAQILTPNRVYVKRYNGVPMPNSVSSSVQSFFILYIACFLVLAVLLAIAGLDPITAFSGAATSISNVGPGLGEIIGPSGNFAALSDQVKWLLVAGMLMGRLEILIVFVLFTPRFWRG